MLPPMSQVYSFQELLKNVQDNFSPPDVDELQLPLQLRGVVVHLKDQGFPTPILKDAKFHLASTDKLWSLKFQRHPVPC